MNRRPAMAPRRGGRDWLELILRNPFALLAFLGFHAALGVLLRVIPGLSLLHAGLTVAGGVAYCLIRRSPINWIYLAGYVAAGEVLWKMTRGAIFWEQGKYFLIAILILAILTTRRAGNMTAAVQFALLLPSAVMTCLLLSLPQAREALSFNLSGPLCLCIAAIYLAAVEITPRELQKLFVIMIGPLFAIAALTVYNIRTVPVELEFSNSSNYFVTGGFGPNQVSAALGLGILLCFFLIMAGPIPSLSRLALTGTLLLMASQAVFTFSRNGLYCGVASAIVAIPFLVTNSKARNRLLVALPVIVMAFALVIFPRIDEFTGGALTNRYSHTDGSGREDILSAELEVWKNNPIFGVGPGVGRYVRGDVWEAAAHTEFSRLVAEHGMFGLLALLLYPVLCFTAFKSAGSSMQRALVIASLTWALSFMLVNAMRMAVPEFMFGLAFAKLLPQAAGAAERRNRVATNRRPVSLRPQLAPARMSAR